jgi:hypothetical protein
MHGSQGKKVLRVYAPYVLIINSLKIHKSFDQDADSWKRTLVQHSVCKKGSNFDILNLSGIAVSHKEWCRFSLA